MKKRTITIWLLAFALVCLCGCAKAVPGMPASLASKGLELTQSMGELAASEAYARAMSASTELAEVIAAMGAGSYSAPKAAYSVSLPKDAALELIFQGEESGLSDSLAAWVEAKAYTAIPTQLAARAGTAALAAASCVAYGESFVSKALQAPALHLYQYEGDYCAMVSFVPGQDGAVNGSAWFVPSDDALASANSAGEVEAWIEERIGFVEVDVGTVSLP